MKAGFASHSPLAAQSSQYWFASEHPGAGAVVGDGADGVGAVAGMTLKSTQDMNVSGEPVQARTSLPTAAHSDSLKVVVLNPTLLKSLHEFPVFQSHRPTAVPPGHENEAGTWTHHSR